MSSFDFSFGDAFSVDDGEVERDMAVLTGDANVQRIEKAR